SPLESRRVHAILDEQSNRSLVRSEFFSIFIIQGISLLVAIYGLRRAAREEEEDLGSDLRTFIGSYSTFICLGT
ncbi:hypothetical protein NFI96_029522, partial [Prochilodus magdalenae]